MTRVNCVARVLEEIVVLKPEAISDLDWLIFYLLKRLFLELKGIHIYVC